MQNREKNRMDKIIRYVLIGIGTSLGVFTAILLLRMLIKGVPFEEGLKD